jgi:hypothetical protein
MRPAQAGLDATARRALLLLRRSEDAQAETRWAEHRLEERDLWHSNPLSNRQDLRAWAQAVITDNPDLVDSLFYLAEGDSNPSARRPSRTSS